MAGRIPKDFIDDLVARADIVEVIDSRVRLKKAGRNHQACCPFHNEKTPSFTVSQDKQFYHCFGCGAHGNVISFLIEHDRLEFPEAVEELASFYSLEVPREKSSFNRPKVDKQQQQDDYQLMEQVARFFEHQLKSHEKSEAAINYLKKRGLSGEIVKHFGIGYAPPEWDSVLKKFGTSPATQQQLLDLKLITQSEKGKRFDFFRDRIMFPIRDKRGRIIGFGGRVLEQGEPKYLNSPETRIFHKGYELYGLYQAKQAHRTLDQVLIVEGYMDVVALGQFGIDFAVASLGTATTPDHIQLLFRSTKTIICCYDGDRAGKEAAWRALENALPYLKDGVEMKFLFLPDGEDPDTLVRQIGEQGFKDKLTDAMSLSKFMFQNLLKRHHVSSEEGKAAFGAEGQALIDKIQGEQQKLLLSEELDRFTGKDVYSNDLKRDVQKANQRSYAATSTNEAPTPANVSPVRLLIRLLLEFPKLASDCPEVNPVNFRTLQLPGLDLLIELHHYGLNNPNQNTGQILENFRAHPQIAQLSKLVMWEHHIEEQNLTSVYRDCFAKLIDKQLKGRIDELLAKSRIQKLSAGEKQELKLLMEQ
ncbi:DNA primase [Alteromonadaceae bacterium M269]|nr:DNA primase [Alteromonadaceae bacterium M269]